MNRKGWIIIALAAGLFASALHQVSLNWRLAALDRALDAAERDRGRTRTEPHANPGDATAVAETNLALLQGRLDELNDQIAEAEAKLAALEERAGARGGNSALIAGAPPDLGSAAAVASFLNAGMRSQRVSHGRSWGPEQATGPPDTTAAGDIPTAWASRRPDGGEEWLKLDYDQAVDLSEIVVVETYNPGAISKVVAVGDGGEESVIWEGEMEAGGEAPLDRAFSVPEGLSAKSVKVYLDTTRVSGWNEIDAVEIVGRDGSRQWASDVSASSTFAEPEARAP